MKLLTAVIAPNRLQPVTDALDGAGFPATLVATAHASRSAGATLQYRGVEHHDQRCFRLEVLVSDTDLGAAVDVLKVYGGQAQGGLTVWVSDVDELAAPQPSAGVPAGRA